MSPILPPMFHLQSKLAKALSNVEPAAGQQKTIAWKHMKRRVLAIERNRLKEEDGRCKMQATCEERQSTPITLNTISHARYGNKVDDCDTNMIP
eukprot:862997-Pelagomonas_calceolata.AAC.2